VATGNGFNARKFNDIRFMTTIELFLVQLLFYDADAEAGLFRVMPFEVYNGITAQCHAIKNEFRVGYKKSTPDVVYPFTFFMSFTAHDCIPLLL
jgi:hypothetical protein